MTGSVPKLVENTQTRFYSPSYWLESQITSSGEYPEIFIGIRLYHVSMREYEEIDVELRKTIEAKLKPLCNEVAKYYEQKNREREARGEFPVAEFG
jgi:hypothetical protein